MAYLQLEAVLSALRCEWAKRDRARLRAQAAEERASAQVRAAAAEDTAAHAFEEVGNMRDQVADLKERLAKVCQSFLALIPLDPIKSTHRGLCFSCFRAQCAQPEQNA